MGKGSVWGKLSVKSIVLGDRGSLESTAFGNDSRQGDLCEQGKEKLSLVLRGLEQQPESREQVSYRELVLPPSCPERAVGMEK